eukprot:5141818-Amphidinium_carterae.1
MASSHLKPNEVKRRAAEDQDTPEVRALEKQRHGRVLLRLTYVKALCASLWAPTSMTNAQYWVVMPIVPEGLPSATANNNFSGVIRNAPLPPD